MLSWNFMDAGLGALIVALVVSLIVVFVLFAFLGWMARKRGL